MARMYRSRGAIGYWVAVTVVAVGLAWVILLVLSLRQEAVEASEGAVAHQEAVEVLAGDVRTLRQQIEASGQEPAAPDPGERVDDLSDVEAGEPVVIRGEDGRDAPPPTAAQIRTAVAAVLRRDPDLPESQVAAAAVAYLQENPPPAGADGRDGIDGRDARPPTEDEIAVAVAMFCADGACRGEGPTDEQIEATVARYCDARGECRGPRGDDSTVPGPKGDDGDDGRGIESITCPEDDWIVEYTDGTSETVPGPCRVEIGPPPPEETP